MVQPSTPIAADEIRVQGIDHATFVVKDLQRSRHFYVDILGMREVPRPAFSFAGLWFQAGKTQIHLILEYSGSAPAASASAEPPRTSRMNHLAFLVDDAEACIDRLSALEIPMLGGSRVRPDGYIQVFVVDPDGHVIELCSPPR